MSSKDGETPAAPSAAWPTDIYITDEKDLFFSGEAIQILHQPNAHTDGDSLVFFRRSDVVSTGDISLPQVIPSSNWIAAAATRVFSTY
jgi:cyclase